MDVTDDDIIGVTAEKAATITGVSLQRIAAWERIGLVRPSVRRDVNSRRLRVYALGDLVDLRIVAELLDRSLAIEDIRKVVEAHRSAVEFPLRQLLWAVDGGRIYVGYPDGGWVGGRRPKQGVIHQVLDLELIRADVRKRARTRSGKPGTVERRKRVLGGKPVFAGTRTPVDALAPYFRRGYTVAQILDAFPHLSEEDIAAARQLIGA